MPRTSESPGLYQGCTELQGQPEERSQDFAGLSWDYAQPLNLSTALFMCVIFEISTNMSELVKPPCAQLLPTASGSLRDQQLPLTVVGNLLGREGPEAVPQSSFKFRSNKDILLSGVFQARPAIQQQSSGRGALKELQPHSAPSGGGRLPVLTRIAGSWLSRLLRGAGMGIGQMVIPQHLLFLRDSAAFRE